MKCLYYPDWDQLEIREVPLPEPGPGEVRIRVAACGLCGSELEAFRGHSPRRSPPLILGHEFCGHVDKCGPGAHLWAEGSAVVGNALIPCGECPRCSRGNEHLCAARQVLGMHRPGAIAEYVCLPQYALLPWPVNLEAREACLAEPLANGVHCVGLTRHIAPASVVVLGAGPIGLLALQAFKALTGGHVMVADLSPRRVQLAESLGGTGLSADAGECLSTVLGATAGEGVDVVVDAAGTAATKRLSLELLRPGGAAVWLGLHQDEMSLSSYGVTLGEKQILGSYAARLAELDVALQLMSKGQVDASSWTTPFSLDQGVLAFQTMLDPGPADIKAIISP